MPPTAKHRTNPAWLLAALVAFVLSLGVHRSLVVCTGPNCAGAIEWVHGSGDCCGSHQQPAACGHAGCKHAEQDRDRESAKPNRGCVDTPLSLEEGPAPERVTLHVAPAAIAAVSDWPHAALPAVNVVRAHAPTTGPPRPPQSLTLLATTVLLI